MMPDELTDLGVLGSCVECGESLGGLDWIWYVDAGSAHLTFCQSCGPPEGDWSRCVRATPTRLTDNRTGERFVRLLSVDEWFSE